MSYSVNRAEYLVKVRKVNHCLSVATGDRETWHIVSYSTKFSLSAAARGFSTEVNPIRTANITITETPKMPLFVRLDSRNAEKKCKTLLRSPRKEFIKYQNPQHRCFVFCLHQGNTKQTRVWSSQTPWGGKQGKWLLLYSVTELGLLWNLYLTF